MVCQTAPRSTLAQRGDLLIRMAGCGCIKRQPRINPFSRYSAVAADSRNTRRLRSWALSWDSAARGCTCRPWRVKAWLARGSCQGSVISRTGAPEWCWPSQAAVRVAFSLVVRAEESPAMRVGAPPSYTRRSVVERASPDT